MTDVATGPVADPGAGHGTGDETTPADASTTTPGTAADAPTTALDADAAPTTALQTGDAPTTTLDADGDGDRTDPPANYAWAPEEPKRRKKHLGLWFGIPGGVLAVAAVAASLVLIAPGTAVAGVPVGGLTAGGAADVLNARLAATTVELTTPEGDATLTGAELGASIDAEALATKAFEQHPLWNVTQWNGEPLAAEVTIDPETAEAALRDKLGDMYVDPVDAGVAFDAASASYAATPDTAGEGIDLEVVRAAVEDAFTDGSGTASVTAEAVPVEAAVTTAEAEQTAANLNGMLDVAGFYVGEERTVPLDRAQVASWLTIEDVDGELTITADPAAIQSAVDGLPGLVDRAPVDARVLVNSAGEVLSEISPGLTGRTLGDTSGVAAAFAAQLETGNAQYGLPVTETAFNTTSVVRRIEVNLSTQRTFLYENDQLVQSYAISSGLPQFATPTGRFKVFAHVSKQDMGALCYNPNAQNSYCTKDVPWVTYFAPDIAFHGAYWHNNFGNVMSHGCVNMRVNEARFVYEWAVTGTEVWVHY